MPVPRLTHIFFLASALTVSTASCKFDPSGLGGGGGGDDASPADAPQNPGDGSPDPTDAPPNVDAPDLCGWNYDPVHFDPCTDPPPGPLGPLVLDMAGTYVYDTSNPGTLTDPTGSDVARNDTNVNGNRIVWASSVTIGPMSELRVVGSKPLIIASESTITVLGEIDASSFWDVGNGAYDEGADSEPNVCADTAQAGESCDHGGGGGGGGGFGSAGGNGGDGANGRGCATGPDSVGGMGGAMVSLPANLRGGCAGGDGGEGDGTNEFGVGGSGGGAIHLTANTTLSISGTVHAGGAGGRASINNRAAGGGGGSGGMIGLEAQSLMLQDAIVAANGGGGGGGANNNDGNNGNAPAVPGEDAPDDGTQASGGPGEETKGGDGGDGGWIDLLPGQDGGVAPDRGGGGAGGGVGYIVLYNNVTPSGTPTRVSPAFTTAP